METYYEKNKTKLKDKMKKYQQENLEYQKEYRQQYYKEYGYYKKFVDDWTKCGFQIPFSVSEFRHFLEGKITKI